MNSISSKTKRTLISELQECKNLKIDIDNVVKTSEDNKRFATKCHCSQGAEYNERCDTTKIDELSDENKNILKDIQALYNSLVEFKGCDKNIPPTHDDTTPSGFASKQQPNIADLVEHVRSTLLGFLRQNRNVFSLLSKEVECHKVGKCYDLCTTMEQSMDTVSPDISNIITDITTDLEDIQYKCMMFSNSKIPTESSEDRDSAYGSDPRKISECLQETGLPDYDSLINMKLEDQKCFEKSASYSVRRRTTDANTRLPVENEECSSIAKDEEVVSIKLHDKTRL